MCTHLENLFRSMYSYINLSFVQQMNVFERREINKDKKNILSSSKCLNHPNDCFKISAWKWFLSLSYLVVSFIPFIYIASLALTKCIYHGVVFIYSYHYSAATGRCTISFIFHVHGQRSNRIYSVQARETSFNFFFISTPIEYLVGSLSWYCELIWRIQISFAN